MCRIVPSALRVNVDVATTVAFPDAGPTASQFLLVIATLGTYNLTIPAEAAANDGNEVLIYVGYGTSGTITITDGATIHTLRSVGEYVRIYNDQGTWTVIDPLPDTGEILLSLHDFREVDANGDVANIAGNGGLLASDTTPIMRGDAAEMSEIAWASSNNDLIAAHIAIPSDFDGAQDVTVELQVYGGTTDLASFTVETGWDGAALVSDTATDAAASATLRTITATIAAADVPDAPNNLTLILTPAAHTTDATVLAGCKIRYAKQSSVD